MDDAEHTVFICDRWWIQRRELEVVIGEEFTVDTMIRTMMSSSVRWNAIVDYVKVVISRKELEEREK